VLEDAYVTGFDESFYTFASSNFRFEVLSFCLAITDFNLLISSFKIATVPDESSFMIALFFIIFAH